MVASALCILGGCDRPKPTEAVRPVVLPPTPPNCPALPELANLRLKDGRVADVRILQDGDLTLYIPSDWFDFNHPKTFPAFLATGYTDPDIQGVECPGVVHKSVEGIDYWIPKDKLKIKKESSNYLFKNLRLPNYIGSITPGQPGAEHLSEWCVLGLDYTMAIVRINGKYSINYNFPLLPRFFTPQHFEYLLGGDYRKNVLASPEWRTWRASALDFVSWLRTPPRNRDNNREFQLGGESR